MFQHYWSSATSKHVVLKFFRTLLIFNCFSYDLFQIDGNVSFQYLAILNVIRHGDLHCK